MSNTTLSIKRQLFKDELRNELISEVLERYIENTPDQESDKLIELIIQRVAETTSSVDIENYLADNIGYDEYVKRVEALSQDEQLELKLEKFNENYQIDYVVTNVTETTTQRNVTLDEFKKLKRGPQGVDPYYLTIFETLKMMYADMQYDYARSQKMMCIVDNDGNIALNIRTIEDLTSFIENLDV